MKLFGNLKIYSKSFLNNIDKYIRKFLLFLIIFYQKVITVHLPKSCRFYPTCSEYTLQAFKKYPLHKAFFLSTKRILKCHPFHPGGYDPLP